MSDPGRRGALARCIAATALVVALAGCGKPPNLDRQEQVAFARGCTSLIERNLSDNPPPRTALLGNDDLNLDEPSAFYSLLERLRGPSTYNLHDPKRETDTARQPLDACSTKSKALSSLFGSPTTTTTSPPSTTVPGS